MVPPSDGQLPSKMRDLLRPPTDKEDELVIKTAAERRAGEKTSKIKAWLEGVRAKYSEAKVQLKKTIVDERDIVREPLLEQLDTFDWTGFVQIFEPRRSLLPRQTTPKPEGGVRQRNTQARGDHPGWSRHARAR